MEDENLKESPGATVLAFDNSVENHFKAMDTISKLCNQEDTEETTDPSEIERLSSAITFPREWKDYRIQPRVVKMASEVEGRQGKQVVDGVTLPKFSAANIPKRESGTSSSGISKDFILYVGGAVWGLDWCPSAHQRLDHHIQCEYLAVAAHSPASSYHKIGSCLTGKGIVQIWCLLNAIVKDEEPLSLKKQKGGPKKQGVKKNPVGAVHSDNQVIPAVASDCVKERNSFPVKKPRGRPRKDMKESLNYLNNEEQLKQASAGQSDNVIEEVSTPMEKSRGIPRNTPQKKSRGRPKKEKDIKELSDNLDRARQCICPLSVEFPKESSAVLNNTGATSNLDGHPLLDICHTEVGLGTETQSRDDVGKSGNMVEKDSTPRKKSRGGPRKKDIKEDSDKLGRDSQFVHPLAVEFPKESSAPLNVAGASNNTNEHPLLECCETDVVLETETECRNIVGQSGNAKVADSTPLKKSRGRPRKTKDLKEHPHDLDRHNQFVRPLAVEFPKESSALLNVTGAVGNTDGHLLLESCETNISLGTKKRGSNDVAQSGNVMVKHSTPLKKLNGRLRKNKDINEQSEILDKDSQFVCPVSVEFTNESSALLSVTGATSNTDGHPLSESCDTDVNLGTEIQCSNEVDQSGNVKVKDSTPLKNSRGRPRNDSLNKSTRKPRKGKGIREHSDDLERDGQSVPPVAVESSKESSAVCNATEDILNTYKHPLLESCNTDAVLAIETQCSNDLLTRISDLVAPAKKRKLKDKARERSYVDDISPLPLAENDDKESYVDILQGNTTGGQDSMTSNKKGENDGSLDTMISSSHLLEDVGLPRVVLCLAHNGRVAWDLKWRPFNVDDLECKHRMGYLAVLLGNGSLEVWEVPSLSTIKLLYSSHKKDGTDPRFVKLEPVFRCSKLSCGDRQSIPLTVEWSPSSPHDLILAGCHDGMVALWKFSANGSCQDTRPLLCFSADTVPIRALAWAPDERDLESGNVIVTAGHGGLRFWDIRDPYRPLWDLNQVRRVVYGLDWLPDPRCVILSLDDGTLRILSLSKAAYDVPVSGKPFVGTQQQGLHSYYCSSFPIWSVQASRQTGQVAYCSADGAALRFQLTRKAVDKDPSRNRAPHFLCGSLTEEDATLTVNTPLPDIPFPMKKSLNECGDTPRSMRGFLTDSNKAKKALDQTPDQQTTLALCYGDDVPLDFGSDDVVNAQKAEATSNPCKKKKSDPYSTCSGLQNSLSLPKGENQEQLRIEEVFPPKIVAMHRVRWNMNKGSERWLCYGGAAGIVRCQEVPFSSIGTLN